MPGKKRVRFPDDSSSLAVIVCSIPNREEFSEADLETLFFSRNEYHTSRSAAKIISKESERYGFSKTLDDVYMEKSKEAQDRLNLWALHGHARRGLERWAHRSHGELRQQDQFQAVMAVLRAQDDLMLEQQQQQRKYGGGGGGGSNSRLSQSLHDHAGNSHANTTSTNASVAGEHQRHVDLAEALRKVSHKATRTARHFARMMGKADAYAREHEAQVTDDSSSLNSILTGLTFQAQTNATAAAAAAAPKLTRSKSARKSSGSTATTVSETVTDEDRLVSLPKVDELNNSRHDGGGSKLSRFGRFGFGRNNSNKNSATAVAAGRGANAGDVGSKSEGRVSRVA